MNSAQIPKEILKQSCTMMVIALTSSITVLIEILITDINLVIIVFQSIACLVCFIEGFIALKFGKSQTTKPITFYPLFLFIGFGAWSVFSILSLMFQFLKYLNKNIEDIVIYAFWTIVSTIGAVLLFRFFYASVGYEKIISDIIKSQKESTGEEPLFGNILSKFGNKQNFQGRQYKTYDHISSMLQSENELTTSALSDITPSLVV